MSDDRFLTLDEVGIFLGGEKQPFPRRRITWLIDNDYLRDNGMQGKARRVPRVSANALAKQIEEGHYPWRAPSKVKAKKTSEATTRATETAAGTRTPAKAVKESSESWYRLDMATK